MSAETLIQFTATVKNIGPGNISGERIYAGFFIDGVYKISGSTWVALASGQSVNITNYWYSQAGSYSNLTAKADYCIDWGCTTITESNETNNDMAIPFQVTVSYPDLIVTQL